MRNIRTLVSKLSDTKRKSDMVISRQSFIPERNGQTLRIARPRNTGFVDGRLIVVAILSAALGSVGVYYLKPK